MNQSLKNLQVKQIDLQQDEARIEIKPTDEHVIEPVPNSTWEDTNQFATELAQPADANTTSRSRRRLRCFECNRTEGHFLVPQGRWFYSYLLGLTFGAVTVLGPYQCQCCGAKRLMSINRLNPRYWYQTLRKPKLVNRKKQRR